MKLFIKKFKPELAIFFACFITAFLFFYSFCLVSNIASFDQQTIITWNYSETLGMVPFRDLFFPYGILSYYKDYNFVFSLLNILIFPIFITYLYFLVSKFSRNKLFVNLSVFSVYFFIVLITGFNIFNRYSVFILFTLFASSNLFRKNQITNNLIFFLGLFCSFVFLFQIDQGLYSLFSFVFLFVFSKLLNKKQDFLLLVKEVVSFISGLVLGLVPLIFYLFITSSFSKFFIFLQKLNDLTLLAKTPFYSYALTPDNIFTFVILFSSIFYFSFLILFKRKKFTNVNFIELGLIFNIILLEQKSIIRSISTTITFPSFILFIFLIYEFIYFNKKVKLNFVYLIIFLFIFPFVFLTSNVSSSFNLSNKSCYSENLSNFFSNNKTYVDVYNKISSYKNFNGKIFSYPGDPIFYVIFKQREPFFTSIYEGSSLYAQDESVNFIEKNNVKYVILNLNNKAIQDGVPNYARAPYLLKYILNNFIVKVKVNNFLILEKKSNSDFFINENFKMIPDYINYLSKINFGFIPYSEGIYKSKLILSDFNRILINNSNVEKINGYLSKENIKSKNIILFLKSKKNINKNTSQIVKIYSHNLKSTITFNSCSVYCVFNISNIPMFYKDRVINKIYYDNRLYSGSLIELSKDNLNKIW